MSNARTPTADPSHGSPGEAPGLKKTISHYTRALRRRFWLVTLLTMVVGGAGAAYTLFVQKPVYEARAVLLVEPPHSLVDSVRMGGDSQAAANYFATHVEMINGRKVQESVMRSLQLADWAELYGVKDQVAELASWVKVKTRKTSSLVDVSIENGDPVIVQKLVNETVRAFKRFEEESLAQDGSDASKRLRKELEAAEDKRSKDFEALFEFQRGDKSFLISEQTPEKVDLQSAFVAKSSKEMEIQKLRADAANFKARLDAGTPLLSQDSQKAVAQIQTEIEGVDDELEYQKKRMKPKIFDSSQAIRALRERREKLVDQMTQAGRDETKLRLQEIDQQIATAAAEIKNINDQITQRQSTVSGQLDKDKKFSELKNSLLASSQRVGALKLDLEYANSKPQFAASPVTIIEEAGQSHLVRPVVWMQVPLCFLGGAMLGCMLVLTFEFADGRIRDPEQALATLDWPLLGVVPRLNRRELTTTHGKLLLASELQGSQVCESFRSLRMGVLGAEGGQRLRSILIASAKPGEGKSFVAGNLASTCARAGETVCLVDMDLRNPTLGEYFDIPADNIGLTEVLEGNIPWPRALVETEVPNLLILPAGNADGVPMDILGTVEMHDLLNELMEKFDRVILDGPAVLGLADSRAVGRFVDGVLLVMRAGSIDARPLARVRQLFENESLRPAGIVFNGMRERHDDLAIASTSRGRRRRPTTARATAPATTATAAEADAESAGVQAA